MIYPNERNFRQSRVILGAFILFLLTSLAVFADGSPLFDRFKTSITQEKGSLEPLLAEADSLDQRKKDQLIDRLYPWYSKTYLSRGGESLIELEDFFSSASDAQLIKMLHWTGQAGVFNSLSERCLVWVKERMPRFSPSQTDRARAGLILYKAHRLYSEREQMDTTQWQKVVELLEEAGELTVISPYHPLLRKAYKALGRRRDMLVLDYYKHLDGLYPSRWRETGFRLRALLTGGISYAELVRQTTERLERDLFLYREHVPLADVPSLGGYPLIGVDRPSAILQPDGENFILILFISTECPKCTRMFKALLELSELWREEGIPVELWPVGAEMFTTSDSFRLKAESYRREQDLQCDIYYDITYDYYRRYPVNYVPHLILFSPDGEPIRQFRPFDIGHIRWKLETLVTPYLNGERK